MLLGADDEQHMVATVPITYIKVVCPPDGLPSVDDWMTTVISFLFTGSRLHREPLDLFILDMGNPRPELPFLGVKKGFTRLMLGTNSDKLFFHLFWRGNLFGVLFFTYQWFDFKKQDCSTFSPFGCGRPGPSRREGLEPKHVDVCFSFFGRNLWLNMLIFCFINHAVFLKVYKNHAVFLKDLVLPLLAAVSDVFNLPATISSNRDPEKVSFENMQLSTQGSERQKKDILKCSLRFEQLLIERKAISRDQNDSEILAELIAKYNSFKANAAIKKWQISPDAHQAIHGIIVGMTSESRALIRSHLDYNKWEESGHLDYYNNIHFAPRFFQRLVFNFG